MTSVVQFGNFDCEIWKMIYEKISGSGSTDASGSSFKTESEQTSVNQFVKLFVLCSKNYSKNSGRSASGRSSGCERTKDLSWGCLNQFWKNFEIILRFEKVFEKILPAGHFLMKFQTEKIKKSFSNLQKVFWNWKSKTSSVCPQRYTFHWSKPPCKLAVLLKCLPTKWWLSGLYNQQQFATTYGTTYQVYKCYPKEAWFCRYWLFSRSRPCPSWWWWTRFVSGTAELILLWNGRLCVNGGTLFTRRWPWARWRPCWSWRWWQPVQTGDRGFWRVNLSNLLTGIYQSTLPWDGWQKVDKTSLKVIVSITTCSD